MNNAGRILIADDEPSVRDSVGYALDQEGFEVTPAIDGTEAEEKLVGDFEFDLLILDIMMPGRSGLDICREVRSRSAVPTSGRLTCRGRVLDTARFQHTSGKSRQRDGNSSVTIR